jgi:hypothetical protein
VKYNQGVIVLINFRGAARLERTSITFQPPPFLLKAANSKENAYKNFLFKNFRKCIDTEDLPL